jgi:hypothetical protein
MIGGSGPTDRSNGGYFVSYRDQFTDDGIAVLWYDKRGVGESTQHHVLKGEVAWRGCDLCFRGLLEAERDSW